MLRLVNQYGHIRANVGQVKSARLNLSVADVYFVVVNVVNGPTCKALRACEKGRFINLNYYFLIIASCLNSSSLCISGWNTDMFEA